MESSKQEPDMVAPAPENGAEEGNSLAHKPGNWSPRFWANPGHVALRFATEEELDAAIDWLWTAPELRELPRVHVGDNTMIVPEGAAEVFRQKGFQFTLSKVVSIGDLSPEEANRVRRQGRAPIAVRL